jgi:hypothetical protein
VVAAFSERTSGRRLLWAILTNGIATISLARQARGKQWKQSWEKRGGVFLQAQFVDLARERLLSKRTDYVWMMQQLFRFFLGQLRL